MNTNPIRIYHVVYYDHMRNSKNCYCVGTLAQVSQWLARKHDCWDPLILDKGDLVDLPPKAFFLHLVNCTGEIIE